MAEGEPEEILRALDQAEELGGAAERRARTYLAAHGLLDHTNRDLRLLVLEVASEDQGAGSTTGAGPPAKRASMGTHSRPGK